MVQTNLFLHFFFPVIKKHGLFCFSFCSPQVEHNQIPKNSGDLEEDFLTDILAGWMFPACLKHFYPMEYVAVRAHHKCMISAGLIWSWECCSSGLISVRSPLCCPWRGRLSLYTSDRTGTSLKNKQESERWNVLQLTERNTPPSVLMLSALIELRSLVLAKRGQSLSVEGVKIKYQWGTWGFSCMLIRQNNTQKQTRLDIIIKPDFHGYVEQVQCSCGFLWWGKPGYIADCLSEFTKKDRNENLAQAVLLA